MHDSDIKKLLDARISRARAKELLIALVKVPSPQTERLEDEPLLKAFITSAIEPRLRTMGFVDIRHDAMGNLIAAYGAGTSLGRQSLTVNHIRSFSDSTHTVQERCEFTFDRQLLPGDDPNEAFA